MLARRPVQAISSLIRNFSSISLNETSRAATVVPLKVTSCQMKPELPSSSTSRLVFLPREISLDIGQVRINPLMPRKEILDLPLISRIIENPNQSRITEIGDLPRSLPVIDLPKSNTVDDGGIQAARLIVIRRRKMRKHKLRKLRKKMKYEWAKVRQRRELRKEKAFQADLIAQIKDAERFSAEAYVADKLRQATDTPIPRFWKGKRLPQFLIKQKLGIE
uniref:(northern house mosquito) hypothetical protein n=1 Tax=Culex pipiens TaxID=7175 RepID=A0A8D8NM67_CULPI